MSDHRSIEWAVDIIGMCEPAQEPEDFLYEYSCALEIDDWEGIAEVARDAVLETVSRSSADSGLAARIERYLDDAPGDGGHSDAAGGNCWELLREAMDELRAVPQGSGTTDPRSSADTGLETVYAALSQAQDCIRGEQPEDISDEEAREDTINKVREAMRIVEHMQAQPQSSGVQAERDRCVAICEGWMERFEGMEIQYTSPREYACDAINDIMDLIRDGIDPSSSVTRPKPSSTDS
ncbi:MAG TPA: hypothetical protein VN181_11675 [Thermoanaerobaculia bacterium]|nr:hypothetical protein [Thermoanaerobaculia bacterium]